MLLIRDRKSSTAAAARFEQHLETIAEVFDGKLSPLELHARKLEDTLAAAAKVPLYADWLPMLLEQGIANRPLESLLNSIPLLGKRDWGDHSYAAFAQPIHEFLHYYETSGTTGPASAAPKALDDLIVNTTNVGEMWARLLTPTDVALILITAPLGPAPYQFEKVFEYLGIMSLKPWVDYIDGDYTKVLDLIDKLSVNVFVGAPSRLLALIQFAVQHGRRRPKFDHLFLIGEQTGPAQLRHLSRLTGACAHVGSYGSSETGTIAATCEHDQLHLQVQSFVLELLDERGPRLVDGSADNGELVVTTLDLPSRPLLRYRTGDLVEIDDKSCACGLALPVVRTQGRMQDVLAMPGGTVRQEDLEAALWSDMDPGPIVLNYMLLVRGSMITCMVTTDQPPNHTWASETARRISPFFPTHRILVQPVPTLSPLASLSGDLGWKLSRVLDLDDAKAWDRLPRPIRQLSAALFDELGKRT
ncbi:phenylacetate--CoA ligase family protein [Nocardia sp. NPDC051929]|uniref:phenylacetate--CoA ligase family protein n=1 Tax=unclassified Nocardia TaxID=2637762 RepID=UPI00341FADF6